MAEAGADPERLDQRLARQFGVPRREAQRLVLEGLVRVEGRGRLRPATPVREEEAVQVSDRSPVATPAEPPPKPMLVYQDALIAVIDKPAGLVVHPGPGHPGGTLSQLIETWSGGWSTAGGHDRPGIVHRLDRGTSGLLVLARTDRAHLELARQLRSREMGRQYWALALGAFQEDRGRIEAAVGRDPRHPRRMAVSPGGRDAVTEFSVLERLPGATALRLALRSGRTHQIRVHLAYIAHPVLGDPLYGGPTKSGLERPALHAAELRLRHPGDRREMVFLSPLPPDLAALRISAGATAAPPDWPGQRLPSSG